MSVDDDPGPQLKKIAILYSDAKREYFPTEELYITEAEVKDRAEIIANLLIKKNYRVELFPGDAFLTKALEIYQPDKVINLVDSVYGKEYLCPTIPATLELLKIPYTGSGMLALSLNANKYLTKNLLEQYGVTTPKYQLIKKLGEEIDDEMDFPLFVKLNENHGALEVDAGSICLDEKAAKLKIEFLMKTYQQPILLEEFIAGREVSAIAINGKHLKIYAAEKIFKNSGKDPFKKIVTFVDNWPVTRDRIEYKKYTLPNYVKENIKTAINVLRIEDYVKFDFRIDEAGRHYLIDVNVNCALGPVGHSTLGSIIDMHKLSFLSILERLIQN